MTAKEDLNLLLNAILPSAKQLLDEYGEFYPLAAILNRQGIPELLGAQTPESHPDVAHVFAVLTEAVRSKAASGEGRAIALCFNGRVSTAASQGSTDAVVIHLEHEGGLILQVSVPYTADGGLIYGVPIFSRAQARISHWKRLQ